MKPPPPNSESARQRWLELLDGAMRDDKFVRLALGDPRGAEAGLRKILVRPIRVRDGPRLSFVYRHATRDITRNFAPDEGRQQIEALLGNEFFGSHLVTTEQTADLVLAPNSRGRLTLRALSQVESVSTRHDRAKDRLISAEHSPWLRALGVATADDRIVKGMEGKFRQIQRFVEVLRPLMNSLPAGRTGPLAVVDMGCGKGYLTFATFEYLRGNDWPDARVHGVETRPELVELCNRVARENGFHGLSFEAGTIASTTMERMDVLIALHACDTATDDAIANGIAAGASLIIVAPCCHKEVRPQIRPPAVLAPALRHGILLERQAEFATDALRAALLEWAGYETKVFEFISPEHTNKNLMIAAVKRTRAADRDGLEARARELATFYGIRQQRLAAALGFSLDAADHEP